MREPQELQDEEYEQVVGRVAAVDVAKASGMVCTRVPHPSRPGRRVTKVWEVDATTNAITELADHLVRQGIEKVTVESTSDYWRPFLYLLQAGGLSVQLVNARDVKNVPGRPKTDRLDAVWLAKLTERGMLRPSFVPPAEIRQLRDYTRLRVDLTHERARYWQRLEKLLEDALIKVSSVASTLDTASTRDMVEALIQGQRDPRLLDQIDALGAQITKLTARIQQLLGAIPAAQGVDADGTTGPGAGSGTDAAVLPAAARLDEITGIGPGAAQVVIAELGLDMGVFPTPGHLVSWAKLCPRTIQSGAKTRAGKTGKGNPYLKGVLGEAAAAAAKTDTFLGERYRRLVKRRGKRKALVAVARSILVIVWRLLPRRPPRQSQEGPQPHPAAGSPRLHRHPRPRSLTRPAPPHPITEEPASPAAAARPAQVAIFGSVEVSLRGCRVSAKMGRVARRRRDRLWVVSPWVQSGAGALTLTGRTLCLPVSARGCKGCGCRVRGGFRVVGGRGWLCCLPRSWPHAASGWPGQRSAAGRSRMRR